MLGTKGSFLYNVLKYFEKVGRVMGDAFSTG